MGRHTQQSDHSLAHTALLTLSILSIGSPVGLLMAVAPRETPQEQTEPSIDSLDTDWLALPQGPPELDLSIPIEKAAASPSAKVKHAKATTKATTATTTKVSKSKTAPTSRPTPTVTTKPTRPTVAQRQIAKAKVIPSTTTTTTKPPPKPSPKPVAKPTTKQQVQVPKPIVKTTTKALPVPVAKSSTTTTTTRTTTTTTKPPPPSPPPPSSVDSKVVAVAKTYVGRNLPYRMGGDSLTTGIDCSHFVWRVLKGTGLSVPYRDSGGLASWTTRTSNPQPGDLVLYSGHVGIYAGNGMMVHHGKPGGAFFIPVYKNNFIGYGRMPV